MQLHFDYVDGMSRYSHPCPVCHISFLASEIKETEGGWFRCPACGEWLQYDRRHSLSIWARAKVSASIPDSLNNGLNCLPCELFRAHNTKH